MPMPPILRSLLAAAAVAALLVACRPIPQEPEAPARSDLSRPALAVRALAGHMRSGDFAAFARDAVPPALHAELEAAWRDGRTRWPLDELPLSEQIPAALGALAAPDAEGRLGDGFERNFAGSVRELRMAASTMGMFGIQYVESQGEYSESERDHYPQLLSALAKWASQAPLADRELGHAAIVRLASAARAAEPVSAEGMAQAGMADSLARIGGFANEAKAVLLGYGLDLDATFDGVDAGLQVQQGDHATVRLRYTLADTAIDTLIAMERVDGQWYVADYLEHAREAVRGGGATPVEPAPAPDDEPAAAPVPIAAP